MSHLAPLSFKVNATLAAQRIVAAVSGTADTVQFPESNQNLPIGITTDTVLDTTSAIPVAGPGNIAKLLMHGTCTSGTLVASDSSGRGIQFALADTTTALTLASAYVGILTSADSVTGTVSTIYINPGFDRE